MAMQLESEIMSAIGLGNHYNWYNGSGSCAGIARAAARELPAALRARDLEPDQQLVDLVAAVAANEPRDSTLTRTWQCAADVIQAHIHFAAGMTPATVGRLRASLLDSYTPPEPEHRYEKDGRLATHWRI